MKAFSPKLQLTTAQSMMVMKLATQCEVSFFTKSVMGPITRSFVDTFGVNYRHEDARRKNLLS